jgi:putative transposase
MSFEGGYPYLAREFSPPPVAKSLDHLAGSPVAQLPCVHMRGTDKPGGGDSGRDGSPSRPPSSPSGPSDSPTCPLGSHPDLGALGESALSKRKRLPHQVPPWVAEGATFFITVNCLPRGVNQLTVPVTAAGLAESVFVRAERGDWWPRLLLFMPDHVHTLMAFAPARPMPRVISTWKRYTARHLGIRWQRDFFDHRIRNEESLAEKWDYILHNPVRAGLVTRPEDWPYVWLGEDIDRDDGRDRSPSGPLDGNDPGRDRSPSGPLDSGSHPYLGALGESALPGSPYPIRRTEDADDEA